MIEFVRLETNIRLETNVRLLLMCNYMIFVYLSSQKYSNSQNFQECHLKLVYIIQFRSHNYIIKCLKISSTVIRVAYHVISGHVRSMNVKWHMCTYHVPLVAQVAQREISLYLS